MPELPEIETIRNILKKDLIGKKIDKIDILFKKQFPDEPALVISAKIVDILRTGKVLSIKLSNGKYLNIHLKLSGQLLFAKNANHAVFPQEIPMAASNKLPARSTRVVIHFKDGSGLFFNEIRKFGWIKVSDKPERAKGVDVLSSDFTKEYFQSKMNSSRQIKIVLMDQDRLAGVGNIYANDALFEARVNPEKKANLLTKTETGHLYEAVKKVIQLGVKYSGSSGGDKMYVLPDGSAGGYQRYSSVYQKEGKPCVRCKTLIKRIKQGGRSSFFCPKCQK
ncbi:DNA-formamidopyrimidine glycosylase [Candidatus Roizmanbacteria bacterium RIFCSPLOWO2_02_FULL_38_10]|uniref:DNA-formamidopyrimidine glycosylase n=1 Tax=Candidatus Roizmanbacteria bacterium RIFCSPLOWO2_02_FULL_38_10 TaxID=1802074 RepID=A0A1F7JMT4_9BACT|nr:MAG: DNA-formamidopyrimidine glycosylase [Candidatus Roizmanbacteria bacterium RIFCSPLOWO2_02_FULL_38_10]